MKITGVLIMDEKVIHGLFILLHRQLQLTRVTPWFLRLSTMRILLKPVVQIKNAIQGESLTIQILSKEKGKAFLPLEFCNSSLL